MPPPPSKKPPKRKREKNEIVPYVHLSILTNKGVSHKILPHLPFFYSFDLGNVGSASVEHHQQRKQQQTRKKRGRGD